MKLLLAVTWVTAALAFNSEGAILTFENFAPSGSLVNINPQFPYTEQGFTLTPLNANSAVFDSAAVAKFPGDNTDWFGFAPGNTITLTGPIPFSLDSVLIGPSTIGIGIVNFTITGNVVGGGVLTATFNNLTTATAEFVGFTNLNSVMFSTTSDAGLDNVAITAVPEPRSLSLFAAASALLVLSIRASRRRKPLA